MSEERSRENSPSPELASAEQATPKTQPPPFQEGGLQGWLTVTGAAIALFATFGAALSFGVFQDYYTRVFLSNNTPSEISWIGSTQLFLNFSVGLPAGRLYDAGHFRLLMLGGSIIYLFSFFMLSIAQLYHYYQVFLSQGIGMGIGMGLVIVPAVSVPSHYFRAKRSMAMGVVFAGSSLGGVIFPVMLNHFINDSQVGFSWGVRATGFLMAGLLLIANLIMKPKYPSNKGPAKVDLNSMFTDGPYIVAIIGSSLIFWGLFFPYFYIQLFSVIRGIDPTLAFYSLTVMNAATVFGRTIPNTFADKYGAFNVAIPMTTVSGALVFAMLGIKSTAGMFLFAIFYGFFSGAFISLLAAIMAGFSRSLSEVGTRIGVAMLFIGFALLTGNPINGTLLKPPRYTWSPAIIFSGVVILSGVVFLVAARSAAVKKRGKWQV